MVVPGAEDDGRPESPSRVHAGAGEGDGEEVAGGDGQSDGEWSRAFHTSRVVSVSSSGEDDENQDHGDDELNTKPLAGTDIGEATGTHGAGARDENTENASSDNGSDTLGHHIQQSFHGSDLKRKKQSRTCSQSLADLGSGDETRGDCRVDVTPRDVAEALGEGGNSHSEAESDLDNIVFQIGIQAASAAHQHLQKRDLRL